MLHINHLEYYEDPSMSCLSEMQLKISKNERKCIKMTKIHISKGQFAAIFFEDSIDRRVLIDAHDNKTK